MSLVNLVTLATIAHILVHLNKALGYAFQKDVIQHSVDIFDSHDFRFVQFEGLLVVSACLKFHNVFTIPLKKAYFVLTIGNILKVPHCNFKRMKFTKLFTLLIIGVLGGYSCQSVDQDDANLFFLKGNVQLTQKNYQEAIRFYKEAIAKNPEFADAYLNIGLAYLPLGQLNEAKLAFTTAIDQDESLLPAYLARAETATRLSQWDNAERDLNKLINAYADSSQFHLIKGNMFVGKNNQPVALAEYDMSLAINPKNAEAYVNRGAIYFAQKAYTLAAEDFEQALKINPNQFQALNNLGLLASREAKWEKALSYLDRALRMNSADPLSLNNKGYVLLQTDNIEEAYKFINRSLDYMPDNGYALRNLGLYYLEKQDLKNSIASFEKSLALAQLVESLHGYAGEAYLQNGNQAKACALWNQGIVLGDSMATAKYSEHCK